MIIDFRIRPPYGSFLDAIMYRDIDRSASFSKKMGMYQARSVSEKSLELMMEEMDEAGIDIGVIPGRKANPQMGIVDNNDIHKLLNMFPNRFVGFAGIEPTDAKQACCEIDDMVINGPFKGIVLEPGVLTQPMYADDKKIYPVYEKCSENKIPLILMIGGNAGPDVSYSMPISVDRIATDFPNLNIIVSHGGWPWVSQMVHIAFRRPNVYISPDMYLVNLPGVQDYITGANFTLQDRFLFATSYPFIPLKEGVEYFCNLSFKPEVLPKLLYKNAANLLGISEIIK